MGDSESVGHWCLTLLKIRGEREERRDVRAWVGFRHVRFAVRAFGLMVRTVCISLSQIAHSRFAMVIKVRYPVPAFLHILKYLRSTDGAARRVTV